MLSDLNLIPKSSSITALSHRLNPSSFSIVVRFPFESDPGQSRVVTTHRPCRVLATSDRPLVNRANTSSIGPTYMMTRAQ
ncbi:hypothetical protein V6N12_058342 [Hibiscus sabdariffa]|uniref:Uncharacterized protein n=1 Tax=Hibiscus sabdariffa TaxID=183260 RepID=A0ABR2ERZ4_9ROSI